MKVKVLVTQLCLLETPWTVAHQVLLPYNFLGKNDGVGSHSLSQGIFLTQGLNPGLLHYKQILYHLSHWGMCTDLKIILCISFAKIFFGNACLLISLPIYLTDI